MLDLCRGAGNFSGAVVLVICLDITRRYLLRSSKGRCREAVWRKQTDCKEEHGRGWLKAKEEAYCHGDGAFHTRWRSLAWAGCGRRLSLWGPCHSDRGVPHVDLLELYKRKYMWNILSQFFFQEEYLNAKKVYIENPSHTKVSDNRYCFILRNYLKPEKWP